MRQSVFPSCLNKSFCERFHIFERWKSQGSYARGLSSTELEERREMVPAEREVVPNSIKVKTWREIALGIISMLQHSKEPVRNGNFKKLRGRMEKRQEYVYFVRKDLIESGIIRKKRKFYELVKCDKFFRKDQILDFIAFIRKSGDEAKVGTRYLREMCKRPYLEQFDFLKFIEEKSTDELKQIVHITNFEGLWSSIKDILDEKLELKPEIVEEMLRILRDLLRHINFHEDITMIQHRTNELSEKVKCFILEDELPIDRTHISAGYAFEIFKEMGLSEDFKLDVIEALLKRKGDAPRILNVLSSVLYGLDAGKVREYLLKWKDSKNEKLKKGAMAFLESQIGI